MRSINKPLAILMSTAALGGGVPAMTQAETAPASTPEMFQECAQIALNESVEYPSADGGPTTVFRSPIRDQVGFGLVAKQDSPMLAKDGGECIGVATLKDSLQLKTGSFTQAIRGASVRITYDNELIDAGLPAKDRAVGAFSYRRVCSIAMSQRVSLIVREERSYTEAGYPTATQTTTTLSEKLPCIKPRSDKAGSNHKEPTSPVAQASS